MKKLLKVSLVAMLVASPMVASAALPTGINYSNGTQTKTAITANANIATTSYVQGAYDAALDAVSAENSRAVEAEGALSDSIGNKEFGEGFTNGTDNLTSAVNQAMAAARNAASGSNEAIGTIATKDAQENDIEYHAIDATDTVSENLEALDAAIAAEETRATTAEGTLSNLTTTAKTNLVAAINEVDAAVADEETRATTVEGTLSNLTTTAKTNLVAAINEVDAAVADEATRATAAEGALNTRVSAIEAATINVYGTWNSGTATPVNLFTQQQQQQPTTPTTTEEPGEGSGTGGEQTGGEQTPGED